MSEVNFQFSLSYTLNFYLMKMGSLREHTVKGSYEHKAADDFI